MKRLHPVSDREQTVAQGRYVYLEAGTETGDGEAWELTRLPHGERIYRVDVAEGRELWQLMLAPDGRPDRLQVRLHDEAGRRFDATYTFFENEVMVSGGPAARKPAKEFIDLPRDYGVLWGPFAGRELCLLGYDPEAGAPQTRTLFLMRRLPAEEGWLSGAPDACAVGRSEGGTLRVPAGAFETEEVALSAPGLPDHRGWLDEHGVILRWAEAGDVRAVLSQYRRYGAQRRRGAMDGETPS